MWVDGHCLTKYPQARGADSQGLVQDFGRVSATYDPENVDNPVGALMLNVVKAAPVVFTRLGSFQRGCKKQEAQCMQLQKYHQSSPCYICVYCQQAAASASVRQAVG